MASYNPARAQQCTTALNEALANPPPPQLMPQYIIRHPIYLPQPLRLVAVYRQPIYALPLNVNIPPSPTQFHTFGQQFMMQHQSRTLTTSFGQTVHISQTQNTMFYQQAPQSADCQFRYPSEYGFGPPSAATPNPPCIPQHQNVAAAPEPTQYVYQRRINDIIGEEVGHLPPKAANKPKSNRSTRKADEFKASIPSTAKRGLSPDSTSTNDERKGKRVKTEQDGSGKA
jgi:hypothetical protein